MASAPLNTVPNQFQEESLPLAAASCGESTVHFESVHKRESGVILFPHSLPLLLLVHLPNGGHSPESIAIP